MRNEMGVFQKLFSKSIYPTFRFGGSTLSPTDLAKTIVALSMDAAANDVNGLIKHLHSASLDNEIIAKLIDQEPKKAQLLFMSYQLATYVDTIAEHPKLDTTTFDVVDKEIRELLKSSVLGEDFGIGQYNLVKNLIAILSKENESTHSEDPFGISLSSEVVYELLIRNYEDDALSTTGAALSTSPMTEIACKIYIQATNTGLRSSIHQIGLEFNPI